MMLHIKKEDSHLGVEAYDLEFYKGQVTEKARGGEARSGTWMALQNLKKLIVIITT